MSIRAIITGGGTGGHVYPGLAVAEGLRKAHRDIEIQWIGNAGKLESKVVPDRGITFHALKISGLKRNMDMKSTFSNVGALLKAAIALRQCAKILRRFKPDFVFGTGGYVSGPAVLQATRMKIPAFMLEPNSYPGLVVKWLAPKVVCVFLGSVDAKKHLRKAETIHTGTPVTRQILDATHDEGIHTLGLLKDMPCILVVGGSQGARNINQALLDFVKIAHKEERELLDSIQIIHQTGGKGPRELEDIRSRYPEADYLNLEYIGNMGHALAAADLVISRAGAATLSEIKARGLPAILIPYPVSAEDHQLKNGRDMEKKNAAIVIRDADLNGRSLFDTLIPLLKNPAKRREMGSNSHKLYNPDSVDIIVERLLASVKKGRL